MVRPVVKLAAIVVLITTLLIVHQLAKFLVHEGYGLAALVVIFLSLPWLSRHLD